MIAHPGTRFGSRRSLATLPALMVALSALAFTLALGCGGGSTGSGPGTTGTAGTTGSSSTPPPAAAETTKAPAAAPAANAGATVFAQKCALCHGPDGRGDGPGSVALNPKPRNFHDQAYMATRTDAQLLAVIRDGKGAMPKWGALLSEAEQKAVLAHVRELGKKP
jgi:mono/diheme cytochrome c family protein